MNKIEMEKQLYKENVWRREDKMFWPNTRFNKESALIVSYPFHLNDPYNLLLLSLFYSHHPSLCLTLFVCLSLCLSCLHPQPLHHLSPSIITYHIISPPILSYHLISSFLLSPTIISYHLISPPILSYHLISSFLLPPTIISYHLISPPILSYRLISSFLLSPTIISYHILSSHFY